jgi:Protein of unknown function (DUF3047)
MPVHSLLPHTVRRWSPLLLGLMLAACASAPAPSSDTPVDGPDDVAEEDSRPKARPVILDGTAWQSRNHIEGAAPTARWEHQVYMNRRPTLYNATEHAGRPAVKAQAQGANSTLSLPLTPSPGALPKRIRFSLFVPTLNPAFDLKEKGEDDAVARLILSFEGDRSKQWTARDHIVSELSSLIAGKPLPYASIMYVWDSRYPAGSVIPNPYTNRIRQIVIESGPQRLNQWVDFDRDIEADFKKAFGETPGALIGLGLMTDSNNSGVSITAWYGPLDVTLSAPQR